MSYTINYFQTLRARFPTWAELKPHILSSGLRIVESPDSPLVVIRCVKGNVDLGLFRSVVWDTDTNLPVSMSPQKANSGDPPVNVQLSATEDFIDGVMVNAFVVNGALQLATRTTIGANNRFYGEKTFSQMFEEALATTRISEVNALTHVMEGARVEMGATSCFASFVVQHPDHRIVMKVDTPALYLVHIGYVMDNGSITLCERSTNWPQIFGRLQINSYSTRYFKEGEAQQMVQRTAVQRGWRWKGLVFKDGSGSRWRLSSPTYLTLRELRGGEATAQDRFLRLRSEKKVMDYLTHYSEDRALFWQLEIAFRNRVDDVLNAYMAVHKARLMAFKDLPAAYKPAVFLLHRMWLDELRPKGLVVRQAGASIVVGRLRDFEQKRLLAAEPFVAPVAPDAPVAPVIDVTIPAC